MANKPLPKPKGEGSGGGKLKLIIFIVLGLLLVAGGSVGVTWFLLKDAGGAAKEESAPAAEPAVPVRQEALYEVLTPAFVVNFKYEGKAHYMQVSVALMGRDPLAMGSLKEHMPLLRNRLVTLFSSQDFGTLITPAGKEILRQQATIAVQELAQKELGKVVIEQVLFTGFVLQ